MKINRLNWGQLFYNNKIVMLFSIALAFISWIALSTSSSETSSKVISDIPISIPLSEDAKESGLSVFGLDDIKAEISVTGNRLILGQLTKNDIQVTAQQSANMINSTGKYTLELTAKKNSLLTDYEFSGSVSPKFITAFVDRHKSKDFEITPNIKFSANPELFVAPTALSSPIVTISGPESVVSSIDSVSVIDDIYETLNKTVELKDLPLNLFDASGNKVNTKNLKMSVTKVNATITILPKKTVSISPSFTSSPNGLDLNSLDIQVDPPNIEVAAPDDIFKNLQELKLEPLDFSNIDPNHSEFELPISLPTGCRVLNNIDKAKFKINLDGYQTRAISINNVSFKNLPPDKIAQSKTKNLVIQAVAPAHQINNLSEDNIFMEADLTGKENFIGNTEIPVKILFKDHLNKCWAYGSYSINVYINKNAT